jgi:hypothetical protein
MKTSNPTNPKQEPRRHLIEAVIAYVAFCGLSVLSRFVPPVFLLVIVSGIAFPLVWAMLTRDWAAIGFTRRNLGQALLWGVGAGLVTSLIGFLTAEERSFAPMLGLQLGVGIPIWLLIMSPGFRVLWVNGPGYWLPTCVLRCGIFSRPLLAHPHRHSRSTRCPGWWRPLALG